VPLLPRFSQSSNDKGREKQVGASIFICLLGIKKTTMNDKVSAVPHPTVTRTMSMPNTPTSPLATNPWYRQKFEFVCSFSFQIYFYSM
jgi:hypothetical protein